MNTPTNTVPACEQLVADLAAALASKTTIARLGEMIALAQAMARSSNVMERVIGATDLIVLNAAMGLKR